MTPAKKHDTKKMPLVPENTVGARTLSIAVLLASSPCLAK